MELKTNYQYTYFIYPFIIKDEDYEKYIQKMSRDKNFKLKILEKEKDINIYKYFLPKTRELLFSSFTNIFEYIPKEDIQGKIDDKKGIFFTIPKVNVICFKTGICFLIIKTMITEYQDFRNILNFNYKFKNIIQESEKLNSFDNIRLQAENFADVETLKQFIKEIIGTGETKKVNLNTEQFLTYSYVCIDQESWGPNNEFEKIEQDFIKYTNLLPADNSFQLEIEKNTIFSKWKYAKIGISKIGTFLFSSTADVNNYTILPDKYEKQYLYTYILNLYKKIYLHKIEEEFKKTKKIKSARKKFVSFTKEVWGAEVTEDEIGTKLNKKISNTIELQKLYEEVNNKYDIFYKDLNIEKSKKTTIAITIMLVISLIFNIINFIALLKK